MRTVIPKPTELNRKTLDKTTNECQALNSWAFSFLNIPDVLWRYEYGETVNYTQYRCLALLINNLILIYQV